MIQNKAKADKAAAKNKATNNIASAKKKQDAASQKAGTDETSRQEVNLKLKQTELDILAIAEAEAATRTSCDTTYTHMTTYVCILSVVILGELADIFLRIERSLNHIPKRLREESMT